MKNISSVFNYAYENCYVINTAKCMLTIGLLSFDSSGNYRKQLTLFSVETINILRMSAIIKFTGDIAIEFSDYLFSVAYESYYNSSKQKKGHLKKTNGKDGKFKYIKYRENSNYEKVRDIIINIISISNHSLNTLCILNHMHKNYMSYIDMDYGSLNEYGFSLANVTSLFFWLYKTQRFLSSTSVDVLKQRSVFDHLINSYSHIRNVGDYLSSSYEEEEILNLELDSIVYYSFSLIVFISQYNFFISLVQLFQNVIWELCYNNLGEIEESLIHDKIDVKNVEILSDTGIIKNFKNKNKNKNKSKSPAPILFSINSKDILNNQIKYSNEFPESRKDNESYNRVKLKTKGMPNDKYFKINTNIYHVKDIQIIYSESDDVRKKKLNMVCDWRQKYNTIKKKVIDKELYQLVRFLPNAKIIGLTGSECSLLWTSENKMYRLKFEKAHGTNEYQGFKLKKILNLIETSYLWGWDKDNIEKHFKDNHQSQRSLGMKLIQMLSENFPTDTCQYNSSNDFNETVKKKQSFIKNH